MGWLVTYRSSGAWLVSARHGCMDDGAQAPWCVCGWLIVLLWARLGRQLSRSGPCAPAPTSLILHLGPVAGSPLSFSWCRRPNYASPAEALSGNCTLSLLPHAIAWVSHKTNLELRSKEKLFCLSSRGNCKIFGYREMWGIRGIDAIYYRWKEKMHI